MRVWGVCREGGASPTCHIHGPGLIARVAPDAQLPVAVVAPALDSAIRHQRARVAVPQGDGGGGDACARGEGCVCARSKSGACLGRVRACLRFSCKQHAMREVLEAFDVVGISDVERQDLLCLISAILRLGKRARPPRPARPPTRLLVRSQARTLTHVHTHSHTHRQPDV